MGTRLDPRIVDALDATGLPWSVELGSKHRHIRLDGRLVGLIPLGRERGYGRGTENTIAQIRRVAAGRV